VLECEQHTRNRDGTHTGRSRLERKEVLLRMTKKYANVRIDTFDGLLVDYAAEKGAGAVLVEPLPDEAVGVLEHVCHMDGAGEAALYIPSGGSLEPPSAETVAARRHFVLQDGPAVFKAAVTGMAQITEDLLKRAELSLDDVAWMVPHQANRRIIEAVAKRLGLPLERVVINLDRYGNTVAGTIPIGLSEWHEDKRFAYGDRIVLSAFGAGFTSGAIYLRWAIPN